VRIQDKTGGMRRSKDLELGGTIEA